MANSGSLKRDVLVRLALVAAGVSLLMLALFLAAYRSQLEKERSHASLGFNLLLQAALENAMLKRDVPGLADIVGRLGEQPGIRGVMILNPQGEVRFASTAAALNSRRPDLLPADPRVGPQAAFDRDEHGAEVLRSVNPVSNKAQCTTCHGPVAVNPVNGILVVDYDAAEIRRQAWLGALAFAGAGVAVMLLLLTLLWRLLSRRVLEPVARLSEASAAIEGGQLDRRVAIGGDDELARLGGRFNRMAERLAEQMARIRAHETYLQEVLDGLPDGVRVIRVADKAIVLANRAYCAQLGRDRTDVVGRTCHDSSHGREQPCVATLVSCPLQECPAHGDRLKATHRHRRADGSLFPVEIHAARVDIDGAAYLVESIRDLAEAARVSHEQRLSELGLLAAGVAHEIHNPLASIRLGVQGLSREIREGRHDPMQVSDYLGLIDGEIDNCIVVTRRLLLLSRAPPSRRQLIDVGAAVDDTLRLLDFDARKRGIEQQLERPDTPIHVLADDGELRMVLLNLLQNAHHAMPRGGRLTARVGVEAGEAVIEITDDGMGIPQEILPQIFDPFFSRRGDGEPGTGLGLTIVKNIVERFGGRVTVDSPPGQGTRFTIHLALAGAPGSSPP
jgi:PAS domain S-box-containing protein